MRLYLAERGTLAVFEACFRSSEQSFTLMCNATMCFGSDESSWGHTMNRTFTSSCALADGVEAAL